MMKTTVTKICIFQVKLNANIKYKIFRNIISVFSVVPPVRPGPVVPSRGRAQTHRPTPVASNTSDASNIAGSSSDGGGFLDTTQPILVSHVLRSKASSSEPSFPCPPGSSQVPLRFPLGSVGSPCVSSVPLRFLRFPLGSP